MQAAFVRWFKNKYKPINDLLYMINNEVEQSPVLLTPSLIKNTTISEAQAKYINDLIRKEARKKQAMKAAQLKALGLTPGISDLLLSVPNQAYSGLYLELKTETGTVSKRQKRVHPKLLAAGYRVEIPRSLEECQQVVEQYLATAALPEIYRKIEVN